MGQWFELAKKAVAHLARIEQLLTQIVEKGGKL
jgi:hypothetical protein